jgi:hypothetical protein
MLSDWGVMADADKVATDENYIQRQMMFLCGIGTCQFMVYQLVELLVCSVNDGVN